MLYAECRMLNNANPSRQPQPMTSPTPPRVHPLILLLAVGILPCSGCQSDVPEMVPVRGRVTLEGGAWPKPGIVDFTPIKVAPGFPLKPGSARFDTDGAFVVKTGEYEGLIPGDYRIAVVCWEKPPRDDTPGKSYIPHKFSQPALSGLTLKIEPGQSGPVIWNHDFPRD